MALTPEQLAELQRLKQMYAPLVEAQRRRDQADANAQKMGIPLTPPTKATGGSIPSMDVMRLAIGGQGPKNWLKGSVERVVDPLKINARQHTPENEAELQKELQEAQAKGDQGWMNAIQSDISGMKHGQAINQWIERNLANYIKKQMATHDDPIRKLAEQGIVHFPSDQVGLNRHYANDSRRMMEGTKLAKSPEAEAWEDAADVTMGRTKVKNVPAEQREPWMEKADPETHLYFPQDSMHAHYLGFDHLVDVLKEDLAEGRLRPEQLSKVSIEHAVRRAHEYDQEKKRKMAETALKATEGMPVHKDYGDGFKWIELAMPKELPEGYSQTPAGTYVDPEGKQSIHHPNYGKLEDALKYEGDTMGHCVGGYCPDVAEGRTRIFSLRDAKNEPHVTIEVGKPQARSMPDEMNRIYDQAHQEANAKNFNTTAEFNNFYHNRVNELHMDMMRKKRDAMPPAIKQIKGKQNAKPKKDYIPYVQDFVKSGKWSEVGDAQNAELRDVKNWINPDTMQEYKRHKLNVPDYATDEELDALHNQYEKASKKQMADGGEVDAEEVFMGKGGKVKELEQYLRDREGEYGLKRLQRAADEIPGLENMYTLQALKEAFGGDNAKALMTMNPAEFEKFAEELGRFADEDATKYTKTGERLPFNQYLDHLAKITGGFSDVPYLEINKRKPEYLPNISGHEGRHRSRALTNKGVQKSLVRLLPSPSIRESMPRNYREDFIEAMKKKLGERYVVPETEHNKAVQLATFGNNKQAAKQIYLSSEGKPQLPEIYKDGGEVDAESYFFPNKE